VGKGLKPRMSKGHRLGCNATGKKYGNTYRASDRKVIAHSSLRIGILHHYCHFIRSNIFVWWRRKCKDWRQKYVEVVIIQITMQK